MNLGLGGAEGRQGTPSRGHHRGSSPGVGRRPRARRQRGDVRSPSRASTWNAEARATGGCRSGLGPEYWSRSNGPVGSRWATSRAERPRPRWAERAALVRQGAEAAGRIRLVTIAVHSADVRLARRRPVGHDPRLRRLHEPEVRGHGRGVRLYPPAASAGAFPEQEAAVRDAPSWARRPGR